MRAAWYERTGTAADVLVVGEMPTPTPGRGEVRIKLQVSGINPGDVKKRQGWVGGAMPYPRVVPHSDGAGFIDIVGEGVAASREGQRVWCYGAQSYRPFGTAAEYVVLPEALAVPLPAAVDVVQGACLGIPGITAHRAVYADGPVGGMTVLVAGAAGGVGRAAVALALRGGATVIATVTRTSDVEPVRALGAHHVIDVSVQELVPGIKAVAGGDGVDRVIEVALGANVAADTELLNQGGIIAAYATNDPEPTIPFWPLLFKNVVIRLLGSDDFPAAVKAQAAEELSAAAAGKQLWYQIAARYPLDAIVQAHEAMERPSTAGRVVLDL